MKTCQKHNNIYAPWTMNSWRDFEAAQQANYKDTDSLNSVLTKIRALPPLVYVGEIETLKKQLAEATAGKRFLLQGGDCAERFQDCQPEIISSKLKTLMQMSTILSYGLQIPVVQVGRIAGQYAKPRSQTHEWYKGTYLPSFRGESINGIEPDIIARQADPNRLIIAYQNSAMTLNYIRSLTSVGFEELYHSDTWELPEFQTSYFYKLYRKFLDDIHHAVNFSRLNGNEYQAERLFFTSHEGLHLDGETAQTHEWTNGKTYNLSSHMLWIGDRTRQLNGSHVEYFRGINNPIGLKVGPKADPEEIARIVQKLNPHKEPGRLTLVTRLGKSNVSELLPKMIKQLRKIDTPILWSCDPMHGNGIKLDNHQKSRLFVDVLEELRLTNSILRAHGCHMGGVHLELTGENVTECIGGLVDVRSEHLTKNFQSFCDPRLNYLQSLELAFTLASMEITK